MPDCAPSAEMTASYFSLLTLSFLDPLIWKAYHVPHLGLDELPSLQEKKPFTSLTALKHFGYFILQVSCSLSKTSCVVPRSGTSRLNRSTQQNSTCSEGFSKGFVSLLTVFKTDERFLLLFSGRDYTLFASFQAIYVSLMQNLLRVESDACYSCQGRRCQLLVGTEVSYPRACLI